MNAFLENYKKVLGDLLGTACNLSDVMQLLIDAQTTLAFDAAEPMSSKGINKTSTVVADVGLAERCTQMEINSYPGCVIIHSQA